MIKCLFCGGEAVIETYRPPQQQTEYFVQCRNPLCQARGPWRHDEQAAIVDYKLPAEVGMGEIKGVGGELRATITIVRAATGKVETVELIGHTDPETHERVMAEIAKNREHGAAGALVGQIGSISTDQPTGTEIQIE